MCTYVKYMFLEGIINRQDHVKSVHSCFSKLWDLYYLFTCMCSPVSNNWRISKRGRHTMMWRKTSASWMVRYKLYSFFFFSISPRPPLHTHTPTHPHGHVSMAMSLFDLSVCLVCPTADSPLELSYVDLILNPERYTGYAGHSPHRIWGAIYHENCFR